MSTPSSGIVKRAYNEFLETEDTITKSSSTERLADELNYYKNIPPHLKGYFAEFLREVDVYGTYAFCLQKYPFQNLGTRLLETFDQLFWENVLEAVTKFLALAKQTKPTQVRPLGVLKASSDMLLKKTVQEADALRKLPFFNELMSRDYLLVNGERLLNFHNPFLLNKFQEEITNHFEFEPSLIHGDLCFSNILSKSNGKVIRLIDPRGSYGFRGVWGDPAYDVAKLYHSCNGLYELIINDKFDLNVQAGKVEFSYAPNNSKLVCSLFESALPRTTKDRLIEGLIFIGMCARHYDSVDRQVIMYCTGLKILNDLLCKN